MEPSGMRKMVLERRGKQVAFKGLTTLSLLGHLCHHSHFTESSDQTAVKSLYFTLLYKKRENKTSTVGLKLRQTPLSHSLPPPMIQIQVVVVVETYKKHFLNIRKKRGGRGEQGSSHPSHPIPVPKCTQSDLLQHPRPHPHSHVCTVRIFQFLKQEKKKNAPSKVAFKWKTHSTETQQRRGTRTGKWGSLQGLLGRNRTYEPLYLIPGGQRKGSGE